MNRVDARVSMTRVLLCMVYLGASLSLAFSQIVSSSMLRSENRSPSIGEVLQLPTARMAAFDVDSARMEMESSSEGLRMYVYAHKFVREIDVIQNGEKFQLADGTQVWRYRVRSSGAKSLSFFFDRFELPEGGLLYVYDSFNKENYIGGFGAINNNSQKVLPTMPIAAEDVVIEVQSPEGTIPQLRIAEVNHGVRDLNFLRLSIPRYEMGGPKSYECTPEIACLSSYTEIGRSVVLIGIDGTAMGTGTLVNNTSGDGAPLILTAAHVMSKNFSSRNVKRNAENTVVFFNYSSPTCSGEIAPNTVQTLAGAELIGYQDKSDVALLEMNQRPPLEYDAYYAGWNASENAGGSYINIHHPGGNTKRINIYESSTISITSYPTSSLPFESEQHYLIPSWTIGTTAPGSSGSPLFDANNLVLGGLSGGNSYCEVKSSDYFFALQKLWKRTDVESNRIINRLDPSGDRRTQCYGSKSKEVRDEPIRRITNISMKKDASIRDDMPQLGRREILGLDAKATMVGESFMLRRGTKVHGVYLVVSTVFGEVMNLNGDEAIELAIFGDEGRKELGRTKVNLKASFPLPLKKKNQGVEGSPVMAELFLEFSQPLIIPNDGQVIFGLVNVSIPDGITLVHQQHKDPERGTLYRMIGGRWEKAYESASLWLEPLISHPFITDDDDSQPLLRLENMPGYGLIVTVQVPDEHSNKLDVYTLQGQRLYSSEILGGKHILPRAPFEGVGVVLIHVQIGDKEETIKTLFPVDIE